MSNPPMPPFLQSFGRDLLALVAGFLLPRIRRRAWWHACGQLRGLVPAAGGRLQLPPLERILVLPQQPFLPLGSLRDQILFPAAADASALGDGALRNLMEQVGLAALAERYPDLGQEEDWSRVLSGGEQQRLGFARLLLRRPALVNPR